MDREPFKILVDSNHGAILNFQKNMSPAKGSLAHSQHPNEPGTASRDVEVVALFICTAVNRKLVSLRAISQNSGKTAKLMFRNTIDFTHLPGDYLIKHFFKNSGNLTNPNLRT